MKNISLHMYKFLGVLVLGSFLAVTVSAYTDPIAPAPANSDALVDTSIVSNIKGLSLPCLGIGTGCGMAVNAFTAKQNALFEKQTFVNGMIVGTPIFGPNVSGVKFGGQDPVSGTNRIVNLNTKGDMYTNYIGSNTLGGSAEGKICAEASGKLVRCPPPVSAPEEVMVFVREEITQPAIAVGCDDGGSTEDGIVAGNVKILFMSRSTYNFALSYRNVWPAFFDGLIGSYDVTGLGFKVKYRVNGVNYQTPDLSGGQHQLLSNVNLYELQADTQQCGSNSTTITDYQIIDGSGEPVPYQVVS